MRQSAQVVRSATLTGYVELVKSRGRDANAYMRTVGLEPKPETLIQQDSVRELLEITARATKDVFREIRGNPARRIRRGRDEGLPVLGIELAVEEVHDGVSELN